MRMLALASPSLAQSYPTRAITMIVPFAPGGPADVLGRLIGQKMGEDLGQQVIIDNRPGANTIIGAQAVAKAKPDGYTLLLAIDGTLVMNPFLYSKLAYDPFKDFEPVALVADVPVGARSQHQGPGQFREGRDRSRQGEARRVERRRQHADLAGHRLAVQHDGRRQPDRRCPTRAAPRRSPASWPATSSSAWKAPMSRIPLWRDNKIKILGLTGGKRLSIAPEIPTVGETLPGFDLGIWQSVVAPAGTPKEIVARLYASLAKVMANAEVRAEAAARSASSRPSARARRSSARSSSRRPRPARR